MYLNWQSGELLVKNLYDVQQFLERFNILVHVGKRKWDIQLMQIELSNLYQAGVVEQSDYLRAKLILQHEYEVELKDEGQLY